MSRHADRLTGDVSVAVPVSWQTVGYLLFGSVTLAAAFLSVAGYSRVETATGIISPDKGISNIIPQRAGIITSLPVEDGQQVPAGAMLASIRAEEDSASGLSAPAQIAAAVLRQDASLSAQIEALSGGREAQLQQLDAQRSGISAEIDHIRSQITLQQNLIGSAQRDYDRTREIAERGFVSQRDLQSREDTLLARQQALSQLAQLLATKQAALKEAGRRRAEIIAQSAAQTAGLAASRALVAQEGATAAGQRSYALRAPIAGRVTALTARLGQPADARTPLMVIVPAGSTLRAELSVPSAAIGFVKPGQEVRLAVDAFPYQRFGTVTGRVLTVSRSAVNQQAPDGRMVPMYPVTVALDRQEVLAFDQRERLVSGMTLSARIVTERQSLLRWLFEPLFAVQRR